MTTHDRDDDVLRSALVELRSEERVEAPPFADVLARRTDDQGLAPAWPMLVRVFAAALVVAVVGTAYQVTRVRDRLSVPPEIVALAAWRPATDALLVTPGSALLRSSPTLGTSLLGAMPALDTRYGGDQR